jgi:hypothetical protein
VFLQFSAAKMAGYGRKNHQWNLGIPFALHAYTVRQLDRIGSPSDAVRNFVGASRRQIDCLVAGSVRDEKQRSSDLIAAAPRIEPRAAIGHQSARSSSRLIVRLCD